MPLWDLCQLRAKSPLVPLESWYSSKKINIVLKVHENPQGLLGTERWGGGGGGGGGYGGGGRGRLYTYCYTVTTRMTPALRWAVMRTILINAP